MPVGYDIEQRMPGLGGKESGRMDSAGGNSV